MLLQMRKNVKHNSWNNNNADIGNPKIFVFRILALVTNLNLSYIPLQPNSINF